MKRSILLIACRWLRRQLDRIEGSPDRWNGSQRAAQMGDRAGRADHLPVMSNMHPNFQGEVPDYSRGQAVNTDYLEKYHRGISCSQQSQFCSQINYSAGQNFINHQSLPYRNQQVCTSAPAKRKESA